MAWTWKKLPVATSLEALVIRLNATMGALERIMAYTSPGGVTADWNPGASIAAGASVGVDVSVPDAQLGDLVVVAFSVAFSDDKCRTYGQVKSAGVVRAVIFNQGAGVVALGPGRLAVNVWRA